MNPNMLGASIAAILFFVASVTWLPQLMSAQSLPSQNTAATHLVQVAVAANQYINNPTNYASLVTASASAPVAITVSQLQASPGYYLNSTFNDSTVFQQSSAVIVYQPSAGNLLALVAGIGGQTIPESTLTRLAPLADASNNNGQGGQGGAIHIDNGTLTSSANAVGAAGDWFEPLANYAVAGYSLTPGHLAILLTFNGTNIIAPYLSRSPVVGHPEAQEIVGGGLNMNNNPITSASTVQIGTNTLTSNDAAMINTLYGGTYSANSGTLTVGTDIQIGQLGNQSVSQGVYNVGTYAPGSTITKPTCPASMTPDIEVAAASAWAEGGDEGLPIGAFQTGHTDTGPTTWQVWEQVQDQNGWTSLVAADGPTILVITKCQ